MRTGVLIGILAVLGALAGVAILWYKLSAVNSQEAAQSVIQGSLHGRPLSNIGVPQIKA